jgi:hypothetical protein
LNKNDLKVICISLENYDFNLIRFIVEENVQEKKEQIINLLLKNKIKQVKNLLPEYKNLLKLDYLITSIL